MKRLSREHYLASSSPSRRPRGNGVCGGAWERGSRYSPSRFLAPSLPRFSLYALSSMLLLIFVSGCIFPGQPVETRGRVPVLSPMRNKSAPRLMGVNHLLTIKGHFSQPAGIAMDAEGNLYVADSGKSVIHILERDGRLLESIGRFGWRAGEFDSPASVAVDAQLRLYIADSGNNRVQRFSLISRNFSIIAGEKHNEPEAWSTVPVMSLCEPQSVAADGRGYIYIADTWNHRILKIDPLGRIQMEIGGPQQFSNPRGVMVDLADNIYISDTGNHRVHKLDFSGSQIAVWGEEGTAEGQFQNPAGQAIDTFRNIYVADQGNHRVQIFSQTGHYLAEFGRQVLDKPVDVAIDNSFRAYVADAAAGDIEVFRIIYEMATVGDGFIPSR